MFFNIFSTKLSTAYYAENQLDIYLFSCCGEKWGENIKNLPFFCLINCACLHAKTELLADTLHVMPLLSISHARGMYKV